MDTRQTQNHALPRLTDADRTRLIRFCAHLTGDPQAAEDLAHETILEALRTAGRLRDPDRRDAWIAGIARNVCLRWRQRRGMESARAESRQGVTGDAEPTDLLSDDFDMELDLERGELARLLDRALALLPPESRHLLVERYAEESTHSEMAARLGISEGAVAVRLHRGRLALRRVLLEDLSEEACAYGLRADGDHGLTTRVWCPFCGKRRLQARASGDGMDFRCPDCSVEPETHVVYLRRPGLLSGIRSPKAIASRLLAALHEELRGALREGAGRCLTCGRPAPVRRVAPDEGVDAEGARPGIYLACARCDPCPRFPSVSRGAFGLTLPETRRFWRAHPRMRVLPDRLVTYEGREAVATRYESVLGAASLDVVTDRETYEVLSVHGPSPD